MTGPVRLQTAMGVSSLRPMRPFQHPAWPHVRAVLVALHVMSLVVLALPTEGAVHTRNRWKTANARADLRQMADRLTRWGWPMDEHELERALWDLGTAYLKVQQPIAAPFQWYAKVSGSRQAWRMFASPQRHPAELHVEVERDGRWVPIYAPHSDEYAWNRRQFEHNRFRKFLGRFARGFIRRDYEQTTRWVATQAAREHPEATRVRVRLYRYDTLPPARVSAGDTPPGRYEHTKVFEAEGLR